MQTLNALYLRFFQWMKLQPEPVLFKRCLLYTLNALALVLGFVFISFSSIAQNKENVTVTVIIENVLSDEGSIIAGLHTEDTFMKGQGIANATAQAATGEVTLTFENISKGILDNIYVTLSTSDNMSSIQCYIDDPEQAAQLSKGQRITIYGKCDGLVMLNVVMKDCKLVENLK